jgi:hypothetical protein
LNEPGIEQFLRNSVHNVDNLADREEEKVQRVLSPCERVERFLDYLSAEEEMERAKCRLDEDDHPMADPIMDDIWREYKQEKEWIMRRLAENRERFQDDAPFVYDASEARSVGLDEDDDG